MNEPNRDDHLDEVLAAYFEAADAARAPDRRVLLQHYPGLHGELKTSRSLRRAGRLFRLLK
jgi:hypothetical protein